VIGPLALEEITVKLLSLLTTIRVIVPASICCATWLIDKGPVELGD
jgi:hypothetical protein